MDLFTFPMPNQDASSEQLAYSFDSEYSYNEWVYSDEMELVRPVRTNYATSSPIGEYSPVESPVESPVDYSYDVRGSILPSIFHSLATSLSDFDFGNSDIWPSELSNVDLFTMATSRPGTTIPEGAVWPASQESANQNQKSPAHTSSIEEIPPSPKNRKKSRTTPKTSSRRKSATKTSPRSTAHSPEHRGAQHHNQIEKKYRTSINERFSVLRAALPETILSSKEVEPGVKKVGKADILDGALKYVKELEEQGSRLLVVRGDLLRNIGIWEKRWSDSGVGGGASGVV